MVFATQAHGACYIRFFNGAEGLAAAHISINNDTVVKDLAPGGFSAFQKAVPGAFAVEVHINEGNSDTVYSEIVSFMPDIAYTLALAGDAAHLDMAVFSRDINADIPRPNVRFANLIPYDTVIDIEISKTTAVWGLMYKEAAEPVTIDKGVRHLAVTIINSDSKTILEDGLAVDDAASLLAIISGSMENPANPPQMFSAEEMPML